MTRFFDYYESGDYITDGHRLKENIKADIEEKHQLFCRSFAETLKSLRAEALF
jgi:hypothetical protein